MNEEKLVIVCDGCRKPIEDGEGFLHVSHVEIIEHRDFRPNANEAALSVAELLAMPDPARWVAHHVGCYPESESVDYDVAVSEVRTWSRLVATTARLMGKSWLRSSNWDRVLEAASRGSGGPLARSVSTEGRR